MKKILVLISSFYLLSCNGHLEERIVEDYYLRSSPDVNSAIGIYSLDGKYFIGVINPVVFAVGNNSDFIVVKQHAEGSPKIDESTTNYFIIPLKQKISKSVEENVIGPLSRENFEIKTKELGVPQDLEFATVN